MCVAQVATSGMKQYDGLCPFLVRGTRREYKRIRCVVEAVPPSHLHILRIQMSRKRKAYVDREEFSRQVEQSRNQHVRKAHFRIIDDGLDEVYTRTTHRVTCAQATPSVMPNPISFNAVVDQFEETKGRTQVGTLRVHKKISQAFISEFTTIGRLPGTHPHSISNSNRVARRR